MIDFWQEIYGTIKRNKLRTFLTGFSVSWGIFILIVLLGAGNGLIHAFEKDSSGRALNSIRIFPGSTRMPYQGLPIGRNIQFKNTDLSLTDTHFKKNIINSSATIENNTVTVSYGTEYLSLRINGVNPNYNCIEPITLMTGRFINDIDIRKNRKIIILNKKSAKLLFKKNYRNSSIGKFVKAGGIMYEVAGIYEAEENAPSNEAYIPFTTSQIVYGKGDSISNIVLTTKGLSTAVKNNEFEDNYRKVMGKAHLFNSLDHSAIWIWNRMRNYIEQQTAAHIIKTAIWIIGILTLLSGIVGVSNIMLITVRERTREFGIRKALGAKPASILKLVIAESITITALFGYIGMVLGILATEYMNMSFGQQTADTGAFSVTIFLNPTVDIGVAIQATLTLIIAGTLAGFFPARKATKVRPIEALRTE